MGMKEIHSRWSSYILQGVVFALTLFIPLYPKIPLFDVAFTWTYIRLEDVLVAVSFAVLTVALIFKRAHIKNGLFWPIVIFWIVGLLSTIWALMTLGKEDNWAIFKPHLIVLHYFRRIEYLGVLFVAYAAMSQSKWSGVRRYIGVLVVGLTGVVAYGLGQKFLHFPAYLTMNEEFSKGTPIALQAGSRLSSTFGGHYDLAGYLVLVLPIVLGLAWYARNKMYKGLFIVLSALGFFVLMLTSSRISFLAFFVSLAVLAFLLIKQKRTVVIGGIVAVLLTLIVGRNSIVERLGKTIRFKQVVVEQSTGKVMEIPTVDKDWGGLPESDRVFVLPFLKGEATGSAYKVTKYEKGDINPLDSTPDDVVRNTVEIPQTATKETMTGEKREIIEEVRTVHGAFEKKLALIFDISFTTRIDGSWPKTLDAFAKRPILGQGYSTVTAAVDSSYVRALGEVGLVGIISFLAIMVIFIRKAYRFITHTSNPFARLFISGVLAGVVGIMVNATLIDIFEASKVAFMLWLTMGVALWVIEKSEEGRL